MHKSPRRPSPTVRGSPSSGSTMQSSRASSPSTNLFASASDIDRACAVIDARRTGHALTLLPICALPTARKSDSATSAKSWPRANIKTLRNVARINDVGQRHRKPQSPNWAKMNQRYQERLQQDRNLRMNQSTCEYKFSVLLLLVFAIAVVVLVLFLKLETKPLKYDEYFQSTGALDDLRQLCTYLPANDSCQGAVEEVRRAVDFDADPCRDFHQYACGRSRAPAGGAASFISEMTKQFNSIVHDKLLNVCFDTREGVPAPYSASIVQMAQFHASCYWMFTGRNSGGSIVDVIQALGIDAGSWLSVRSAERLVELTVSTSLKTGLTAFLDVRISKGEVHLRVGTAIATVFFHEPGVTQYVAEAVIDLNVDISDPVAKTVQLDHKVDALAKSSSEIRALRVLAVSELVEVFPEVEWLSTFNRGRPPSLGAVTNGTKISLYASTFIAGILQVFHQEQHNLIGFYGLLSILSTVMKFAYHSRRLSFEEPLSEVKWCLLLTAWSFSNLFPVWMGTNFLPADVTARFRKAFNEVMAVLLRDNVVNFGVYLEATVLNRTWLNIFGESVSATSTAAEPYPVKVNDTFLPNLAAVIAAQVGTIDRDGVFLQSQALVAGQLGYGSKTEGQFMIPPALVASRGFLSLRVPEVDIGLFTLRYLILRAIYDRSAAYQSGEAPLAPRIAVKGPGMAYYVQSCFGQSLKKSLNKSLSDGAIKSLMGGRWAAATALSMSDHEPVTSRRLDKRARRRLLFLALCASGCGDPDEADQCSDVSRIMPEFINAYGCAQVVDYKCDCSAVNSCETHLPSVSDAGPG